MSLSQEKVFVYTSPISISIIDNYYNTFSFAVQLIGVASEVWPHQI